MRNKIVFIIISLIISNPSYASSTSEEAAKIAAQAYAKEQVKEQLRVFLNKNPQLLLSKSSQVGTKSIQFLSKMLAAYDFITAETDRERFWAGLTLVSPDPTTTMIILAVQIGDAVIEIKHQKGLAKIYKETANIRLKTVELLTRFFFAEYSQQLGWVQSFETALSKVSELENKLKENPVYKKLSGDATIPQLEDKDIAAAIDLIFKLDYQLLNLERSQMSLKLLNTEALDIDLGFVANSAQVVDTYLPLRAQIRQIKSSFVKFYALAAIDMKRDGAEGQIAENKLLGELYLTCINEKTKSAEEKDSQTIEDCRSRFPNLGVTL